MQAKVAIKDLSVIYDNGDGVRNINLEIQENELITLLGPSGCGKTTILRAIGGFNKVTSGQILVDGQDVTHQNPEHRPTGMVFQSYNLWPHMTVYENLAFGLKLRKVSKADIRTKINEGLGFVHMQGFENKFPSQLSGGQQQRVAIARSLLLEPAVLLLDEPFSALDAKIRHEMRTELKSLQRALGLTVVFVTHDQEEAMAISDRIVVMDKGVIAQEGSPNEIYDHPASRYVASFIGTMNIRQNAAGESIAIRPEDVQLASLGTYPESGQILEIMLMGHYAIVLLETVEYGQIQAYISRNEVDSYAVGQAVAFNVVKEIVYAKE